MVPNARVGRVSRLPLLIMVAVLVMAALLTIALVASRDPKTYPVGTPEAALQEFVAAAIDNDEDAMLALLTDEMRLACTQRAPDDIYGGWWSDTNVQAHLASIEIDGVNAKATVRFREGNNDDPFNGSSWDFERPFSLLRVDDTWLVERAGWPYPFDDCTRGSS